MNSFYRTIFFFSVKRNINRISTARKNATLIVFFLAKTSCKRKAQKLTYYVPLHEVMSLSLHWIILIIRVLSGEQRFGTGIDYETISSGFPVFWVVVRGCSRKSYGTSPNLWVLKKIFKLKQSNEKAWFRPAEFFGTFFSDLSFNFFRNLKMYSWAIPGSIVFCDWVFLVFSGAYLETAANILLFLKVAMIVGEKFCQLWRLNWIFKYISKAKFSSYHASKVSIEANS